MPLPEVYRIKDPREMLAFISTLKMDTLDYWFRTHKPIFLHLAVECDKLSLHILGRQFVPCITVPENLVEKGEKIQLHLGYLHLGYIAHGLKVVR